VGRFLIPQRAVARGAPRFGQSAPGTSNGA
jgi:hypothetical protein